MAKPEIRIIPKRRQDVDVQRLAQALLDLIDRLSPKERNRFIAEGEQALNEVKSQSRPKGSAA